MSTSLLVTLVCGLLVVAWIAWIWQECATATDLLRASIIIALREKGVLLKGDPFGSYSVEVSVPGLTVEARNAVLRRRPGTREDESSETVCLVEVPLQAPDFIVCRADVADIVMGPLPAVPRTRSGHSLFDAVYSIFAAPGSPVAAPGYRDAPIVANIAWAQPAIVERLLELGLRWIRVREARAEIAFDPLQAQDAVRAALTCANIVRAAAGAGLMGVALGARCAAPLTSEPLLVVFTGLGGGIFLGLCVALPVAGALDLDMLETSLICFVAVAAIGCAGATRLLWRKAAS